MIVQTLVVIATMLVLAGAILTSTLVSAKAVLHQTMLTKTQTAMTDATAAFVSATQKSVQRYGTQPTSWPVATPTTEPICVGGAGGTTCPYIATMSWAVTGSSGTLVAQAKAGGSADAAYLANTVDEQRISATISVQVSNTTGREVFAERSREITARIFTSAPYAIVTGTRDIASQDGTVHASEGDTAGAEQASGQVVVSGPVVAAPAQFTDTRILTSIDCQNSQRGAKNAIGNAYFDRNLHPYGNISWHMESACTSGSYATSGIPPGYAAPVGSLFVAQPSDPNDTWEKGDENISSFAR